MYDKNNSKQASNPKGFIIGRFIVKRKWDTSFMYLILSIISLIICSYDVLHRDFLIQTKAKVTNLLLPVKKVIYTCIKFSDTVSQIVMMKKENINLKYTINELQTKLKILEQQNNLHMKLSKNIKQLDILGQSNIVQVLGFENKIFSSHLIIALPKINSDYSAKSANSINIGQVVSSNEGLIGVITNVSNNIGLVRTITDTRIYIPVKNHTGMHLILKGTNSDNLISIDLELSQDDLKNITIGDTLYTSGEGGIFPQNIPVAKVISINYSSWQIKAKTIVNFNKLEFAVIHNPILKAFIHK